MYSCGSWPPLSPTRLRPFMWRSRTAYSIKKCASRSTPTCSMVNDRPAFGYMSILVKLDGKLRTCFNKKVDSYWHARKSRLMFKTRRVSPIYGSHVAPVPHFMNIDCPVFLANMSSFDDPDFVFDKQLKRRPSCQQKWNHKWFLNWPVPISPIKCRLTINIKSTAQTYE